MQDVLRMGDVVRLVIGGPLMRVTNADGAMHEVWCSWSDKTGTHRDAFIAASLIRVESRDQMAGVAAQSDHSAPLGA
jgi:uncharacterized protein YodC (DUF2158 family)